MKIYPKRKNYNQLSSLYNLFKHNVVGIFSGIYFTINALVLAISIERLDSL